MPGHFTVLILLMIGLHTGCTKNGGVCVSSSGQIMKQVRNMPDFNEITLNDNVSLILTTDTITGMVVEAGSNLINGITTTVDNNQLTISNTNSCNWLRSYDKPINIYVSSRKIWKINYNGSGDINSTGTLNLDSLSVDVWGGCGTIDLTLNVWKGNFSLNMGTVDFRLQGICAITTVFTGDYGLYDGRDLNTGYTYITSKGSNDCYVKATNTLESRIESIGNIYYSGNPQTINSTITGTGELISY